LYFPRTYIDLSKTYKINEVITNQFTNVKGLLSQLQTSRSKFGKALIKAKLNDETGSIDLIWFNQPYLQKILKNGQQIILTGKVNFEFGRMTMQSPQIESAQDNPLHSGRIIPIYHETFGLNSKWIREKIHPLLKYSKTIFPEYLPENILKEQELMSYAQAIYEVHFPQTLKTLEKAKRRLGFDELFLIQLGALQKKWHWQNINEHEQKTMVIHEALSEFEKTLPFALTSAQRRSLDEILNDQQKTYPMSRLLQGDVGSGKTVVAGIALLNTIKNGYQGAIMAPTEILARQHYHTLFKLFKDLNINLKFMAGSTKKSEKTAIMNELKNGLVDIIIGTHALIQQGVTFKNLGLAVIDEQHRFGVKQRDILKSQGSPHLLSLSATPIPRTLALTIYGDQDLSIIDELPSGREPIITRLVPENKRSDAYRWIEDKVKKGRQAFVICPLIDESDTLELKSVIKEFEYLQTNVFPELKIGLLHGKMKAADKEAIMQEFKENKTNILVSTSVIEVGIDIPNAVIMMIEGAERFGLSQLHQFRGRVGRSTHQSYCFLFMQKYSQTAATRLRAMVDHTSGFKLSEIDLEIRGPGHVYGIRQSGIPDLKMASLTDSITISKARNAAEKIITNDPDLKNLPYLAQKLQEIGEVYVGD